MKPHGCKAIFSPTFQEMGDNAKFAVLALGVKYFTLFVMAGLHLCCNLFLQPNWDSTSQMDRLSLCGLHAITPNAERGKLHMDYSSGEEG